VKQMTAIFFVPFFSVSLNVDLSSLDHFSTSRSVLKSICFVIWFVDRRSMYYVDLFSRSMHTSI
jgi:hypothetical protein